MEDWRKQCLLASAIPTTVHRAHACGVCGGGCTDCGVGSSVQVRRALVRRLDRGARAWAARQAPAAQARGRPSHRRRRLAPQAAAGTAGERSARSEATGTTCEAACPAMQASRRRWGASRCGSTTRPSTPSAPGSTPSAPPCSRPTGAAATARRPRARPKQVRGGAQEHAAVQALAVRVRQPQPVHAGSPAKVL